MVEAEAILSGAAAAYRAALGERLLAAYALGSLAHGGFCPLVSDVDLGLIVSDPPQTSDGETIKTVAETQKHTGSELAERLSVFWGTPSMLRGERTGGRFPPLDRLDLIENGRLLTGADVRARLPRPSAEELLISGARFALETLAGVPSGSDSTTSPLGSIQAASPESADELREPRRLARRGPRRVTKLVLFPVRFMFSSATGRVGTNADAVDWYLAREEVPSKALVQAALAWRQAPPEDEPAAGALLAEQLIPLYVNYIEDHIARLASLGEPELVRSFERWREQLQAGRSTLRPSRMPS